MERLSKRFKEYCVEDQGFLYNPNFTVDELLHIIRILYLEEQGLPLRLPCKLGDKVYVHDVDENDFEQFHCGIKISEMKFEYWMITLFGTCIFNTREEAEAALHMQGDRHD